MNKFAITLTAGATAMGVLTTTPALGRATHSSAGSAPHATSSITWGKCSAALINDVGADSGITCAKLHVPRDYSDPAGKQITLKLSLIKHTSSTANYQGVMLSNPGGPGGSGLDLGAFLAPAVPNGVGGRYDWVSWDPRGVGESVPAIHCQPHYFHFNRRNYKPHTASLLNYWVKRTKSYAGSCEQKFPGLLENMKTTDNAKDMESIRTALGVPTISYFGYSYGTYLGQVYSTLFPSHLKYMVLDSNVDPRRVWYKANLDQDLAFERNINIWFKWLAKYHKHYGVSANWHKIRKHFFAVQRSLYKHPIGGKVGGDEWSDLFLYAGYYRQVWIELGDDYSAYVHKKRGYAKLLASEYDDFNDVHDDNEFAVYNATQCTDTQWPTKLSKWLKDNKRVYAKAPFETYGNMWFNAPCLYWGAKAGTPVTINGAQTPSVLLIDETLDAATPYQGSLEVRSRYPHASLLAEPGGATHADSLDGDACVDNTIANYLATGHRPARKSGRRADKTCKPLPDPNPTSSAFRSAAARSGSSNARTLSPVRLLRG